MLYLILGLLEPFFEQHEALALSRVAGVGSVALTKQTCDPYVDVYNSLSAIDYTRTCKSQRVKSEAALQIIGQVALVASRVRAGALLDSAGVDAATAVVQQAAAALPPALRHDLILACIDDNLFLLHARQLCAKQRALRSSIRAATAATASEAADAVAAHLLASAAAGVPPCIPLLVGITAQASAAAASAETAPSLPAAPPAAQLPLSAPFLCSWWRSLLACSTTILSAAAAAATAVAPSLSRVELSRAALAAAAAGTGTCPVALAGWLLDYPLAYDTLSSCISDEGGKRSREVASIEEYAGRNTLHSAPLVLVRASINLSGSLSSSHSAGPAPQQQLSFSYPAATRCVGGTPASAAVVIAAAVRAWRAVLRQRVASTATATGAATGAGTGAGGPVLHITTTPVALHHVAM